MKRLFILAFLLSAPLPAADMSIWIQDTTPSTATQGSSIATVYLLTNGSSYCFSNPNSFTWYISSGALPPGIVLTGSGGGATMNGTPTSSGSFPFTIRVVDNCDGSSLTASHTIVVSGNTPPVAVSIVGTPPSPQAGSWVTVTATWRDANGWTDLKDVMFFLNNAQNSAGSCYIYSSPSNNTVSLLGDDSIQGTLYLLGTVVFLTNNECVVDVANSSYTSRAGTDVAASFRVQLKPGFPYANPVNAYMFSHDYVNNQAGGFAAFLSIFTVVSSKPFLIITTYH